MNEVNRINRGIFFAINGVRFVHHILPSSEAANVFQKGYHPVSVVVQATQPKQDQLDHPRVRAGMKQLRILVCTQEWVDAADPGLA